MVGVDTGIWVLALMATGAGIVTFWSDRRNDISRALGGFLTMLGLSVAWGGMMLATGVTPFADMVSATFESLAIFMGVEWGRRIAGTAPPPWRRVTRSLLVAAQILVGVFWGLRMGYALIFPDHATALRTSLVPVSGVEFAVFAPLIGASMLLSAIALLILQWVGIDRIERIRLRAFMLCSPFLLSGLVLSGPLLPLLMSTGLLIFFAGSVRYLMLQVARGTRLRQFVAAEVAGLVQDEQDFLARRERREISVVACDLRGFTALAQQRPSDHIMALLERYYARAGQLAAQHGAAVKDHAGDGLLMLVGAPVPIDDTPGRALRLAAALASELHPQMQADDGGLGLGVGVATGLVSIGAVRGAGRLEYAAVGSAVNLAARLCSRALSGQVLVDEATQKAAPQINTTNIGAEAIKGFDAPVPVYRLSGV